MHTRGDGALKRNTHSRGMHIQGPCTLEGNAHSRRCILKGNAVLSGMLTQGACSLRYLPLPGENKDLVQWRVTRLRPFSHLHSAQGGTCTTLGRWFSGRSSSCTADTSAGRQPWGWLTWQQLEEGGERAAAVQLRSAPRERISSRL